jgi:hypothetical protein
MFLPDMFLFCLPKGLSLVWSNLLNGILQKYFLKWKEANELLHKNAIERFSEV